MNDHTFLFLFTFISVICVVGYYFKLLTKSGSLAAFFIGITVSIGFGLKGLLLLGFFFITSSLWSKFKRRKKLSIEHRHEKGSRRDWAQVVANGGSAAIFCLLYTVSPQQIWVYGFVISIAAANSDTWASEIGSLSKNNPIFIRSLRRTQAGTSGAISLLGTFAALCGAFSVALLSYYVFQLSAVEMFLIFVFGFGGNLIDTFMGAFFQVVYQCRVCASEVEARTHCGMETGYKKGLLFMNNDVVNFSSGFLVAVIGILFLQLFLDNI